MTTFLHEPERISQILEYATEVLESHSGLEQRICRRGTPLETYQLDFALSDADYMDVRGELFRRTTTEHEFPLRHEQIASQNAITGTSVTADTRYSDWVKVNQKVLVENTLGQSYEALINAIGSHPNAATVLTLSASPPGGQTYGAGSKVSPLAKGYVEDRGNLGREQKDMGRWQPTVRLTVPIDEASIGTGGGSITTFDSKYLLDKREGMGESSVVAETVDAASEMLDQGGAFHPKTGRTYAGITRVHSFVFNGPVERQWWKLFLRTLRGRQKAFLCPTWTEDLQLNTQPSAGATTLVIKSTPDYVNDWFPSAAHKWIQILHTTGSIQRYKVNSCVDNGNGTQTLTLNGTISGGTVDVISFMELSRLLDDRIEMTHFPGARSGRITFQTMVVQR